MRYLLPCSFSPPTNTNMVNEMARPIDRVISVIIVFCSMFSTTAKVHTVGDASGWKLGVDYSTWTSGKTFAVGDSLVFKYNRGLHTVNEVSANDYQSCSAANSISTDSSGSTTVVLETAGTHHFLCSVPPHCSNGMKFAITVRGSKTEGTSSNPAMTSPSMMRVSESGSSTTTPITNMYSAASRGSPSTDVLLIAMTIYMLAL